MYTRLYIPKHDQHPSQHNTMPPKRKREYGKKAFPSKPKKTSSSSSSSSSSSTTSSSIPGPKYKGVTKNRKRFQARIRVEGKLVNYRMFPTALEAAMAHDEAAMKLGRPLAKLNFPEKAPANYKPSKRNLPKNNTTGYRGVYVFLFFSFSFFFLPVIKTLPVLLFILTCFLFLISLFLLLRLQSLFFLSLSLFFSLFLSFSLSFSPYFFFFFSFFHRYNTYKTGSRFKATITIQGKLSFLGNFPSTKEAAIAYDLAALNAGRSRETLNFPNMKHDPKRVQESKVKKRKISKTKATSSSSSSSSGKASSVPKMNV